MNEDTSTDTLNSSNEMDRIDLEGSNDILEEDLFQDDFMRDYEYNPLLDKYETEDEEYAPPLSRQEIESAEREISQALGIEVDSQEYQISEEETEPEETSGDFYKNVFLLEKHLSSKDFLEGIKRDAIKFIKSGKGRYMEAINQMASYNKESIYVDYFDLERNNPKIARAATSFPGKILPILNEALQSVVREIFPKYSFIKDTLIFRLINIPAKDTIRGLRNENLNGLVNVSGIVTKRSRIHPVASLVKYTCQKCKAINGPFLIESEAQKPSRCNECQTSSKLVINQAETLYKDYQKITIQEVPGSIPPGRLPRSKEVILQYDLIDSVRPGDEIELTGTYKNTFTTGTKGTPSFYTCIEGLSIIKKEDESSLINISPEDEKEIKRLSKVHNIMDILIRSMAPSIHGNYLAKRAIILAVFGGVPKHSQNNHKVRGDINVLLLGDPGMAKSQLLKYVQNISHRSVFSTGQGASAVGLTAMVKKDAVTREWTLEGGALVLADKGICLIDEFDKMKDTDRVSIHEAMEQQSISISKAGIVTSLQARCAIIAAANPIRGKYNSSFTFQQNVNLSDPIISRFDVICVLQDILDREKDKKLAEFIVTSHRVSGGSGVMGVSGGHSGSHKEQSESARDGILSGNQDKQVEGSEILGGTGSSSGILVPQDILRKYIAYARERVHPRIEAFDTERISSLYAALRKESSIARGIPITVRHVESMIRIAEASAKMHLREVVNSFDVDVAVEVVLDSFCSTQKVSVKRQLLVKFRKYLPNKEDIVISGMNLINSLLVRDENTSNNNGMVKMKEFKVKASDLGISYKNIMNSAEFREAFKVSSCGAYIIRK
ncbi:uncharacterized protein NESG_00660 [Nematocida ausubeli]|uniref:DNA replication licensing factor MCM2 n=1 Tax=Nematocida ausubeli (strain ATCC PRA-371 / ERTm2) TaxID=1913371 RepID=A0A086J2Z4_NEMA1|nr:uncharacterized protein NESG_00660 [Nematocida ausubeli]KFG26512.1 hypothetical protein NESG_00660 [Nematocida ausubeli]